MQEKALRRLQGACHPDRWSSPVNILIPSPMPGGLGGRYAAWVFANKRFGMDGITGSYSEMGSEEFCNSANLGT